MLAILITIAVALSMDTFSLSLTLGTYQMSLKKQYTFCIFVGLCHFIFPLIGNLIGIKITKYFLINANRLLGIIFFVLFLKLLYDLIHKKQDQINFSMVSLLLLAFSVSLDSLTTGIGLSAITNNYLFASFIFLIVSFSFTLFGQFIGNKASNSLGKLANYFGLLLLFILAIVHLCK